MQRYDIINHLSKRFAKDFNYLEIGVDKSELCFDLINTVNKTGIEPKEEKKDQVEFSMTSDQFFSELELGNTRFPKDFKWDIIFVDGLHLAYQTYRDIINSVNHINSNGFIVVHDCNPPSVVTCHSDYEFFTETQGFWNGTVWKAMYVIRTQLKRKSFTIDTDWGVGVIDMLKEAEVIDHTNIFFDYGQMKNYRQHYLGLISVEEFLSQY